MYSWGKDIARWVVGETLYLSVPFTWLVDDALAEAQRWRDKRHSPAHVGGPGLMEPTDCPGFSPVIFHNPCATFTTRGCPNRCPFCAVHKLEPDFYEIPDYRPAPLICDNNLLAASREHLELVVKRQQRFELTDFNQGLEARLFTKDVAQLLGQLRCKVRFAFDRWPQEAAVRKAIDLARRYTTNEIGVYCLIGFKDTPEDARARLEMVRSWGVRPNPMRYQPLDAKKKNEYLAPGWTIREMRKMQVYYSRLVWYDHIKYEDFRETGQLGMELGEDDASSAGE